MAQRIDTRTIHTIFIDIQDDILGKFEANDEVEVVLSSRSGQTLPKKLSYRDLTHLTNGKF